MLEHLEPLRICSLQEHEIRGKNEVSNAVTKGRERCGHTKHTKTEVLEAATGEHTGTARAARAWTAAAALVLLWLLHVDRLGLGLRVVALLRLATVRLLRRRRVVTLLRGLLAVALLGVSCGMRE